MGRSLKKGPFVDEKLYRKVEKLNQTRKKEPIKTWARRARSCPSSSGTPSRCTTASIFNDVFVTEDMVGHKLGEFSHSRTFRGHTNKKEGIDGGDKAAPPEARKK
jgi:small subunit ribosomal protein S19